MPDINEVEIKGIGYNTGYHEQNSVECRNMCTILDRRNSGSGNSSITKMGHSNNNQRKLLAMSPGNFGNINLLNI